MAPWLVVLLAVLAAPHQAAAHPAPFSYLDLDVTSTGIEGLLVLHVVDIAHELGIADADTLLAPAVANRERDRVVALVSSRFTVRGDGAPTPRWLGMEPVADRHGVQLRFTIPGAAPGSLTLDANLFPYDPLHQTFVNVYEEGALRQQMIFAADSGPRVYYMGTTQGALAVMGTFIPAGVHHIMIGPDHILFLVGLLLLGGTWVVLVQIVTAFTVGHSITLSLAALSLVTPSPQIIEPAIALSIVFVGADNLVRGDGRDLRALVALVFGLVHGFGFANVLREFGLPTEALGWSLFSFNVGVEIGQLGVVFLVTAVLVSIRRWSEPWGRRVAFVGSIIVVGAGAYWFIERVFFPGSL